MWLKTLVIDFICLQVIKVSGVIYLIMVYYTTYATGQAEIAYTYSKHAQIAGLVMLIVARFEESPFGVLKRWRTRKAA
jgi:hypothetical protein